MTLPVTTNLVLHLDATEITGFTDGDPLTTWEDLSSSNNDGTQAGSESLPIYKDSGGFQYAEFADDNERNMETSLNNQVNNFYATGSNQYSISVIFRYGGSNGIVCGAAGGIGSSTTFAIFTNSGNICIRLRGNTNQDAQVVSSASSGDWHMITFVWDGSSALAYFNGGSSVSLPVGTASNQEYNFFLGSSRQSLGNYPYFTGDIAEVVVYETNISSSDQESVEQYLGEKWLGWDVQKVSGPLPIFKRLT